MQPFGEALSWLAQRGRDFEVIIPVVPTLRPLIERRLKTWTRRPHLVEDEEDKFRAFKLATVALAASGTVTLELALAGTPMVVAYKVDPVIAPVLRRLITAPSTVLPNLVLGDKVFPEFHQGDCTGGKLANALAPLLEDGPQRARQLAALARIPAALRVESLSPSEAAARIVLDYADNGRGWPRHAKPVP
jgi:lipid-A-disaccharide synthase